MARIMFSRSTTASTRTPKLEKHLSVVKCLFEGGCNTNATSPFTQNDALKFSPCFRIKTTPKAVTPFGGLCSLFEFFNKIGLASKLQEAMPFTLTSPNAIPPAHTLMAFLSSVIAGAKRFAHTDWLRSDKAFHVMLGVERFPGTDTVRNLFARFTQGTIEAFSRPLWRWLLPLFEQPNEGFSLDLDSTVFQRSGQQEGAAKGYNPRRPGRKTHHPLLAVLAEAQCVLHGWLRSGNTADSRGVSLFLAEALKLLPAHWKIRCVRADSGFFAQELLCFLEERALPYLVVAKLTQTIKRRAAGICNWTLVDEDYAVGEFFATESAFLAVLFTFNLLSLYQKVVQSEAGYRQPATLRTAVFLGGAVLGRAARKPVLLISEAWGGLQKHIPLIERILEWKIPTSPKLNPAPPGPLMCCSI
jgi:hypothetical protein